MSSPLLRSRVDDISWYALSPTAVRIIAVLLMLSLIYAGYAFGKSQATQVSVTDVTLSKSQLKPPAAGSEISALSLACTDDAELTLTLTGSEQVSMTITGDREAEVLAQKKAVMKISAATDLDIGYTGQLSELTWATTAGQCTEVFSSRSQERSS